MGAPFPGARCTDSGAFGVVAIVIASSIPEQGGWNLPRETRDGQGVVEPFRRHIALFLEWLPSVASAVVAVSTSGTGLCRNRFPRDVGGAPGGGGPQPVEGVIDRVADVLDLVDLVLEEPLQYASG
jgi:hypothetical protein